MNGLNQIRSNLNWIETQWIQTKSDEKWSNWGIKSKNENKKKRIEANISLDSFRILVLIHLSIEKYYRQCHFSLIFIEMWTNCNEFQHGPCSLQRLSNTRTFYKFIANSFALVQKRKLQIFDNIRSHCTLSLSRSPLSRSFLHKIEYQNTHTHM